MIVGFSVWVRTRFGTPVRRKSEGAAAFRLLNSATFIAPASAAGLSALRNPGSHPDSLAPEGHQRKSRTLPGPRVREQIAKALRSLFKAARARSTPCPSRSVNL